MTSLRERKRAFMYVQIERHRHTLPDMNEVCDTKNMQIHAHTVHKHGLHSKWDPIEPWS